MASMKLPKGMRLKPEDCVLLGDDICRMIRAVLAEAVYNANGTVLICGKRVTIKEEKP